MILISFMYYLPVTQECAIFQRGLIRNMLIANIDDASYSKEQMDIKLCANRFDNFTLSTLK